VDNFTPILDAVADKSVVNVVVGQFIRTEQSGSIVVVATAPGQMPVKCRPMSDYRPEPLELVRVMFVDGVAFYAGAAQSKPGKGVVATVGGGLATVVTDIGTISCSYSTAPSSGNAVKLAWNDGPHIMGPVASYPIQSDVPADPIYQPKPRTYIFKAKMSGRAAYGPYPGTIPGVWTPGSIVLPQSGVNVSNRWYYGRSAVDSIPVGAVVTRVEIYLPKLIGNWSRVFTQTDTTPEQLVATIPTFPPGNSWDLDANWTAVSPRTSGWVDLPIGFATQFTTTEMSVQPSSYSGGGSDIWQIEGLDLLGNGTGDNNSGAIRITAKF